MGYALGLFNLFRYGVLFYYLGDDLFIIVGQLEIYQASLKYAKSGTGLFLDRYWRKNARLPKGILFSEFIFALIVYPIVLALIEGIDPILLVALILIKSLGLVNVIFLYQFGAVKSHILEILKACLGLIVVLVLYKIDYFTLRTYTLSLVIIHILPLMLIETSTLYPNMRIYWKEILESMYMNMFNLYRVSLLALVPNSFVLVYPFYQKVNGFIQSQYGFYFKSFKNVQSAANLRKVILYILFSFIALSFLLFVLINLAKKYIPNDLFNGVLINRNLFLLLSLYSSLSILVHYVALIKGKRIFHTVQVLHVILFLSVFFFKNLESAFLATVIYLGIICIYFSLVYKRFSET